MLAIIASSAQRIDRTIVDLKMAAEMTSISPTPKPITEVAEDSRAKAAARVWQWESRGDASRQGHKRARRDAALRACAGLAASAILISRGREKLALVAATIAIAVFLVAMASPTHAYAALEKWLQKLAAWVGVGLGWLLLLPLFYFFFLPFGLLFRRGKNDKMGRHVSGDAVSFWRQREGTIRPLQDYERHF